MLALHLQKNRAHNFQIVLIMGSFYSPPQDMASSSPAWAWAVEVLRDTLAEASFELQKAPCLEFEPGSCPWEAHSY